MNINESVRKIGLCNPNLNVPHFQNIILTSYCIDTTKYWLHAIFKENELASSPLTLHKDNILLLLYCWINCFMVWLKFFVALHNDSLAQQSSYVTRQMFLCLVANAVV